MAALTANSIKKIMMIIGSVICKPNFAGNDTISWNYFFTKYCSRKV